MYIGERTIVPDGHIFYYYTGNDDPEITLSLLGDTAYSRRINEPVVRWSRLRLIDPFIRLYDEHFATRLTLQKWAMYCQSVHRLGEGKLDPMLREIIPMYTSEAISVADFIESYCCLVYEKRAKRAI